MRTEDTPPRMVVYGRRYCHLCDEMVAELRVLQQQHAFSLELADVDSDPALEARYGELVPVLVADDRELCHYHLDSAAVLEWLRSAREARTC